MTTNAARTRVQFGNAMHRWLMAASVLVFAAGLVDAITPVRMEISVPLRWLGIALFIPVAVRRRSLLIWTFFLVLA
jgi:proton glutamate symport protein